MQAILVRFAYLWVISIGTVSLVFFLLYFITPKFKKIFFDFGVDLPATTQFVIRVCDGIAWNNSLAAGLWWLFVALLLASVVACLPGAWGDAVRERLLGRVHAGTVLRALAVRVESGRPLPETIGILSASYPRRRMRARLARTLTRVQSGIPWFEALRRERLLTCGQAVVLEMAQRVGNLPWALREMADAGDRQFGYRAHLLVQLTTPVLVGMCGATIGVFAAGYFLPLVALLNQLGE